MKIQFHYYFKEGGTKHIAGIRDCKHPKRTKIYKQLLNSLDMGFVEVVGFDAYKEN
jgi:hypothetical protein